MKIDRRVFCGTSLALAAGSARAEQRRLTELPVVPAQVEDTAKLGVTQNLRYAVNIEMWDFGTNDPAVRIARAADLGFNAIEMWPWRGKDIDAIDRVRRERNVEIVQFTGWGFTPGLNDPANHDAFVAEITASCETAQKLGTKMMLVVAGNDRLGVSKDEMHQAVIDGLKRAVPIADKYGITLILEPMNVRVDHKGHCLYGSPDAIRIVKAVDSPRVKLCWDLYHMQISEGDLCGRMKEGFAHIAYFQLADHPGRRDPSTGEVNYQRVMKEAFQLGYRGYVGLEFTPRDSELEAARRVAAIDRF
ncbi:MAG: TIM barrel protein [Planctomycetota bacterium]|nr:TIM barrel protein [Planctomycetota bacterium]